ncbi:transcriptional regulator, MerR family [Listeria grayi DSM 20601]|uniref:Transcriptional regulator, MerR family n=2 Tax=Listeria grayi TaxID=1641 RepID=D7UZE4_LISGR|nr:transcriptional regulator, MerR family [Listeria grayi DSM 20601]
MQLLLYVAKIEGQSHLKVLKMMNVKEISEMLQICTHTISYYDKEGLFPFIDRDEHGYRNFSEEDVYWVEFIRCMRSTHMPITELRKIAELFEEGRSTKEERRQIFENHRANLLQQKELIDIALRKLNEKFKILDNE